MMKQHPDEFFREKLEKHAMPAPDTSWDRIENKLSRKQNSKLWMKIAAAISLLALALIWLLPISNKQEITIANNTVLESTQSKQKEVISHNKTQSFQDKEKSTPQKKSVKNFKPLKNTYNYTNHLNQGNSVTILPNKEQINAVKIETIALVIETADVNSAVIENIEPEIISTTIVYTASDVNAKYLTKTIPDHATPSNEKTSSFRKFIHKASDLKNNQDVLGEIRQKKNEILALNRNEKNEQNN